MSYILEAIRRSEDERRKRVVPDVSTVHARVPVAPPRRSRLLHGTVAGGIALGVAAIVWLQTHAPAPMPAGRETGAAATSGGAGGPEDGPSADPGAISAAPPRPQAPPVPSHAEAPSVRGHAEAPAVGEAPPAKAGKPRAPRTPYSAAAEVARATPPAAAAKVSPRAAALPPGPLIDALPPGGPGPGAAGGADAAGSLPAQRALAAPPEPEFVSAIALRDLPDPIRQSLPDIAISLHRYASSAEARQVRVNGRAVREGDSVGTNLSVAEITRGGVVFTIGNQRFYMSAFQNWRSNSSQP